MCAAHLNAMPKEVLKDRTETLVLRASLEDRECLARKEALAHRETLEILAQLDTAE